MLPSEAEATVIPLLTADTPSSVQASPTLPAGPTKVAGQYEYDGLGAVRSTQEYALGTNTSLTVTGLNYGSPNLVGGMQLPAGWTGYRMRANISSLYDQLYWVQGSRENGDFGSGAATPTNWTRVSSGMGDNSTWPSNPNYGCNYGAAYGYSGKGVQAWVEFDTGSPGFSWDATKYVAWENTVAIPRDSPNFARLTFRVCINTLGGSTNARGRMVIYVYVAGKSYPLLPDVSCPNNAQWYQLTVSIPDDDLATWPQHGTILVRLGLSFTSAQSAWDYEYWGFDFDDVTLEVRGKAQPQHTWLQLQMNATTVVNGASYGLGTVTVPGNWVNPGTSASRVVARWSTASSSSAKVDFTYNLTLYIRRSSTTEQQMPPDGSSFWVRNQSSVYWSAWFYAYQPYYFQRYNLTIQRPTETWTLVKATDPQFVDRTSLVQTNSTHFLLPYTAFYNYGWWNFNCTSTNRVSSLTLNSKTFQIAPNTPNTLTVTATLSVSTGEANLTLYSPSGSVVKEEKKTVTGLSVAFTSILFNTDNGTWFPPGVYTLCVSYDDGATGSMTAAGFKSALITVKHGSTTLTPEQDPYLVTRRAGSYFYPRLQLWDNDTAPDSLLTGATVAGNWTGLNAFYASGSWYEAKLAADAKAAGNYTLRVNATFPNYGDAYRNIKIVVFEETALSSPDSPGMTQPYNKQVGVRFYFKKVYDSTPVTGATVTSDWPGASSPTLQGNGWYNFTIDTAQVATPGTYYMTVTAKKLNHQQQILTLTIVVRERNSLMTATSPPTVAFDQSSMFNVSLSDLDAAGAPITNSSSPKKVHLSVWYSGTRWDSIGRATIQEFAAVQGKYNVTINTSYLPSDGTYPFEVRFYWWGSPNNQPFHANRTMTVYVGVRKVATAITYDSVPQTPWDQNIPVTFYFRVDDVGSQYNGQGITSATFTIRLDGSLLTQGTDYTLTNQGGGQYLLTLLSSSGKINTIKTYNLEIQGVPSNAKYGSATRTLSFTVRALKTTITYSPPLPVPWGNNVVITFNYTVDDTESTSHNGQGISGVTSIAGTTLDGTALTGGQYTLVDNGQGRYTLTILYSSGRISTVKSYTLALTVVSPAAQYQNANRQVNFAVRRLITQATYDPPTPTPRGDNVVIVFYYKVNDPDSAQHNTGVAGVTSIAGTTLEGGALTQGTDYTLVDNGGGKYTLTLLYSSGKISTIKLYTLQLHVVSPDANHDAADRTITFSVRTISTRISYVPLVDTPRGTDVVISFNYTVNDPASSQNGQGITGVTSIAGSTLDGSPLTGSDYQLTWVSGGKYSLTIRYSSGKISTIKSYTLALHVVSPDAYHDAADQTIPFGVRKIRTVALYDAVGSVAWGQDVVITFYFRVDDSASSENGNGLTGVTSIAGTTLDGQLLIGSDYVLASLGAGKYTLTIRYSSGKISTVKAYSLALHVVSPDSFHENADQTIGFAVRVHVITCSVDAISRIPYQNFLTFTLRINDSDLTQPLPDRRLSGLRVIGFTTVYFGPTNWTGGVQYVTNGSAGSGIYYVTIDSRTWPVQSHSLTTNVYPTSAYGNGVAYASAVVRKLAITFIRDAVPTVPWDEDGNVNTTYSVSDAGALQDGSLLSGATISVTRLGVPLVRYTDFNYVDLGSGRYMIVFYRTLLGNPGTKTFNVTIHLDAQHDDGTLRNLPITVRPLLTWLHPISVPQTAFGDNVYIKVAFEVLDAQSTRHNGQFISTADIRVNASSWVKGTQYIVTWLPAEQLYNITIYQSYVPQIRWYKIQVDATNPGVMYEVASIPRLDFQVRTAATALTVVAPASEAWGNNITITVTYLINDPDSRRNGQGITGQAGIMRVVGYSKPAQYTVTELGGGSYRILLNSSAVGVPGGSYTIAVNTSWAQYPPPYAVQTKQFQVLITNRPTDTPNSPGVEFGYADFIIANFTYVDLARSSARILNTSYGAGNILVKVYWKHPVHTGGVFQLLSDQWWNTTAMAGQPHAFKLTIKADFAGYVDTYYDFNVSITWKAGTAPYFASGAFTFRAYVVGQRTNLSLQPTQGATPYRQIMNFTVVYLTVQGNPITNQTPNNYVHFRMLCPKVPGLTYGVGRWTVQYVGAGYYTIHVWTTALGAIDTYLFYLNVTYDNLPNPTPPPYYQSQYNMPIIQEVRAIDTLLTYVRIDNVYAGENVFLLVDYRDTDNNVSVPNSPAQVNITVTWQNGTRIATVPTQILAPGPYQYWWTITIPTAGIPAGQSRSFVVITSQTFYQTKSTPFSVYIKPVPLQAELLTDPVIEKYYGEAPPPVTVVIRDVYSVLVNDSVVTGYAVWGTFPLSFIGAGTYSCTLNTNVDRNRYLIEIRAYKAGQYANASVYITLTITAGPSSLTPSGMPTSFIVYAGDNFLLTVNYTTGGGSPITGAQVTYSCASNPPGSGTMNEDLPGIYSHNFTTDNLYSVIYTITVTAFFGGNTQSQTISFTIDVRNTPIELRPVNDRYILNATYLERFTINIFAANVRYTPAIGQTKLIIQATWPGLVVNLQDIGGGWYAYEFLADLDSGFTYLLYLDMLNGTFAGTRATLYIEITRRLTSPLDNYGAEAVNGTLVHLLEVGTLQVPVGDWLWIFLYFNDTNGLPIASGSGSAVIDGRFDVENVTVPGYFEDLTNGYYVLKLYMRPGLWGLGVHRVNILLTKTNYVGQSFQTPFTVIPIPTELRLEGVTGQAYNSSTIYTVYVGAAYDVRVLVWDTFHGVGVEGANLTLPSWMGQAPSMWEDLGGGHYVIHGMRGTLGEVELQLAITANKELPFPYVPATFSRTIMIDFRYSPTFVLITWGGSAAAIILVALLVGWLLWIRVFSIPWEVRRMRSLAKKVDRDQTFELSGKDRKHFRDRPVAVEDTVGKAMSPVGVAVTAAMLPTTKELVEVSATEEDLMGDLDKIPGLGAEEKAVLAQEMRKIPRKDRVWFLDDLRRQMGERRMDFLTTKTPTPAPAPLVRAEAAAKPGLVEAPKPVTPAAKAAKPKEKVEKPEKAEKPEKPKERVAPTVRPKEEHIAPPPTDAVEAEIRRELDKIPGLTKDEKNALLEHLKYLTPEERRATYQSLRQTADK